MSSLPPELPYRSARLQLSGLSEDDLNPKRGRLIIGVLLGVCLLFLALQRFLLIFPSNQLKIVIWMALATVAFQALWCALLAGWGWARIVGCIGLALRGLHLIVWSLILTQAERVSDTANEVSLIHTVDFARFTDLGLGCTMLALALYLGISGDAQAWVREQRTRRRPLGFGLALAAFASFFIVLLTEPLLLLAWTSLQIAPGIRYAEETAPAVAENRDPAVYESRLDPADLAGRLDAAGSPKADESQIRGMVLSMKPLGKVRTVKVATSDIRTVLNLDNHTPVVRGQIALDVDFEHGRGQMEMSTQRGIFTGWHLLSYSYNDDRRPVTPALATP